MGNDENSFYIIYKKVKSFRINTLLTLACKKKTTYYTKTNKSGTI